jgi:hypothetical protein
MALHPLLDNFKVYKGIVDDTSQDDKLSMLLYTVTDFLKSVFNLQVLKQEDITKTYNVQNHIIVLDEFPINLTNLVVEGVQQDLSDIYVIKNIIKNVKTPLQNGYGKAEVTYDAGFDEIPMDLQTAIFILAARLYENSENSGESMEYLSDPNMGRMRMLKQIPPEFYILIAPYRGLVL